MEKITLIRGDTKEINVVLTQNDEPFIPKNEKVVLTVKKDFDDESQVLIQHDVINGKVKFEHDDTVDLEYGNYVFDVRVYNPDLSEVQTPIVGKFKLAKVVNNDLQGGSIDG